LESEENAGARVAYRRAIAISLYGSDRAEMAAHIANLGMLMSEVSH